MDFLHFVIRLSNSIQSATQKFEFSEYRFEKVKTPTIVRQIRSQQTFRAHLFTTDDPLHSARLVSGEEV